MTDIDPRLRTELGQRAEQIDVTGDFAARAIAIEGRAHRRRVATAALGGALALAVAAPLVYSSLTPDQKVSVPATSTTAPAPTATSVPTSEPTRAQTASPTAIPTINADPKALVVASPKLGAATGTPDVPYAVDGVLHDGDRRVPLPMRTNLSHLLRLDHGGALVAAWSPGAGTASIVDSAGKVLMPLPDLMDAAASGDGTQLVTSDQKGGLTYRDSRGAVLATKAAPACASSAAACPGYRPVGIVGDIVYAVDGIGGSIAWDTAANTTKALEGQIVDVSTAGPLALVLDTTNQEQQEPCYTLVDLKTFETRWRSCRQLGLVGFSPGGTYILATRTMDGAGPMTLGVVRTEDARLVLEVSGDSGIGAWTSRMNDAETAVTFSASEGTGASQPVNNALVRCELTGACTVVGDSRKLAATNDLPSPVWMLTGN